MGLLFLSGERVTLKRRKMEMLDVNKLSWQSEGIPPTLPPRQNWYSNPGSAEERWPVKLEISENCCQSFAEMV